MSVVFALVVFATVGALLGYGIALLADAIRTEMRRFDAGADRVAAQIEADREQAHRTGRHARPGGHGDCLVCGDVEGGL